MVSRPNQSQQNFPASEHMARRRNRSEGSKRMSKSQRRIRDMQQDYIKKESGTSNEAIDPQRFLSEDFLLVLDEHRKNCEREGKLEEAA